jgi:bacillithiol system protein YtxJ
MFEHAHLRRLGSPADLDDAIAASAERPVLLFKHSTRCGVSAEALEEVTASLQARSMQAWVVTVQTDRGLSNDIAARFGIRHESPQLLVLREGKVAWHASHFRITAPAVTAVLDAEPSVR